MKRSKYILFTGLFCLLFSACELDETPYSNIYTNQFYQTPQDAEAALIAVYGAVGDLYSGPAPLMVSDFSADQVYPRPVVGRDTYTLFTYEATYSTVRSFARGFESPLHIWQQSYSGIEKANWVIQEVPNVQMSPERRSQIVAEALFLRAFFYWTLSKNFGDVVLKTTPSTSAATAEAPKVPKAEIYAQIYQDLEAAAQALPSRPGGNETGRPSREAALALHAKAALYDENWSLALQKAQEVINAGTFSLMPDVRDVYNPDLELAARQENMFSFESDNTVPGRTSQIMGLYGPPNSNSPAFGNQTFGSIFAYPAFFDSFDPADTRRRLLDTSYVDRNGAIVNQANITPITPRGVLVKKYMDPQSNGGNTRANIHILRMADVYLIAAEAEARLNGATGTAFEYLNTVRRRAGVPDLQGLGAEELIEAVLRERSWELFAEGDRWYDLTRTGKFLTVIPAAVNDVFPTRNPAPRHRYFPIPQDEIDANPLVTQNPDWQ
jgi:starch-binding outer membrane protein, SusD/RagB family